MQAAIGETHQLRYGLERELVDLETWRIRKSKLFPLLSKSKTVLFPDDHRWSSFIILYHTVLQILSPSSYSMTEHNSHWQELHKNSHKFIEHPCWVQAIGSKDAKTQRADPCSRGVYRLVGVGQVRDICNKEGSIEGKIGSSGEYGRAPHPLQRIGSKWSG